MKTYALVMHNVGPDMFFTPNAEDLHHAHTFTVEADNIEQAANLVWTLTNVDGSDDLRLNFPHLAKYAPAVTHYRDRRNRSLSVADVIAFFEGERYAGALAIEAVGLRPFTLDPTTLRTVTNDRAESDARRAMRDLLDKQAGR